MPFCTTNPTEERKKMIEDWLSQKFSKVELAAAYGVTRPTLDKWIDRFKAEGYEGLEDRSTAPKSCPHKTDPKLEEMIVEARRSHPRWGGGKLKALMKRNHPGINWPAESTFDAILKRNGLTEPRRKRRKSGRLRSVGKKSTEPNGVWTADFKGEFRTRDGQWCYPLTIVDEYSHYIIACQGLESTAGDSSQEVFEEVFERHGMPAVIRSDNGVPFSVSHALCGLSQLSVWWIRLGIRPERIDPGRPEQNGSHERMHRTLKDETAIPPAQNATRQQKRFDQFRAEFNHYRPHETLEQTTPGEHYERSERTYCVDLEPMEYPAHFEVRTVSKGGYVRWKGQRIFLSGTLARRRVGFEEVDYGVYSVRFGPVLLGRLDGRTYELKPIQSANPAIYQTNDVKDVPGSKCK